MSLLPQVLEEAAARAAFEVILESGQPVLVTSHSGSESTRGVISETELFDALATVLGTEEQADLAVGNVVSFHLEGSSGRWSMLAEPGPDGICVRGRLHQETPVAAVEMPSVELPAFDPYLPDEPEPAYEAPPPARSRNPAWDEGDEAEHIAAGLGTPPVVKERASAFEREEDDDWHTTPTRKTKIAAVAELIDQDAESRGDQDIPIDVLDAIEPGSVCFVHGDGIADALCTALELPCIQLGDSTDVAELRRDVSELGAGCIALIRAEDPSVFLAWILRRCEEGWRIVVESRARTPEGACRILMGQNATARAEAWLFNQPLRWIVLAAGRWSARDVRVQAASRTSSG